MEIGGFTIRYSFGIHRKYKKEKQKNLCKRRKFIWNI